MGLHNALAWCVAEHQNNMVVFSGLTRVPLSIPSRHSLSPTEALCPLLGSVTTLLYALSITIVILLLVPTVFWHL